MVDDLTYFINLIGDLNKLTQQKNEQEEEINYVKNLLKEIKDFDKIYYEMKKMIWGQTIVSGYVQTHV